MTLGSCSPGRRIILEECGKFFEAYIVNLPGGNWFKPVSDRFIAVLTDITEWNRLEIERGQREIALQAAKAELERLSKEFAKALEAAEQANQSKMRLLAGMSHELRTPLNGILGYNRLLSMEGGLSQMQLGRVKAMQEAGEHLLEMISTLLDLSAIEMNNMALQICAVELPAFASKENQRTDTIQAVLCGI